MLIAGNSAASSGNQQSAPEQPTIAAVCFFERDQIRVTAVS